MSPKKHEMTVIHCNYTGLSLVRQVNYTVLHIPGKFMYVLCNLEFSWRPRSRLNTSTITAGAQYSENTHTHRTGKHFYMDTSTLLHTRGCSAWVTQAHVVLHGVLLYVNGQVDRMLAFRLAERKSQSWIIIRQLGMHIQDGEFQEWGCAATCNSGP